MAGWVCHEESPRHSQARRSGLPTKAPPTHLCEDVKDARRARQLEGLADVETVVDVGPPSEHVGLTIDFEDARAPTDDHMSAGTLPRAAALGPGQPLLVVVPELFRLRSPKVLLDRAVYDGVGNVFHLFFVATALLITFLTLVTRPWLVVSIRHFEEVLQHEGVIRVRKRWRAHDPRLQLLRGVEARLPCHVECLVQAEHVWLLRSKHSC
mmetsp:Transcript_86439/g.201095  ORF Transcript_86439/g.201095 Transcript_86439/m.201095 type:complete len:210 (-) Transcript_86439:147-776(-)